MSPVNAQDTGMEKVWFTELDRYEVDFVMLDLDEDNDLVEFFQLHPTWSVDFEDEGGVIFARVV